MFTALTSVDPFALAVAAFVALVVLLGALVFVIALLSDRDRVRVDPHEAAYGDIPGFSRDQLERYARMPTPPHASDMGRLA